MRLTNKVQIYSLKNERPQRHIGEYFQVLEHHHNFFLFYCSEGTIKVCQSTSLNFDQSVPTIAITNAPGGCFVVFIKDCKFYMLCGSHVSYPDGTGDIEIPDHVWRTETRKLIEPNVPRSDRKNGLYLLSSTDGLDWKNHVERPVMSSMDFSTSCPLGTVAYDTSPCVLEKANEFYFFGRINTGLDKREIYFVKSTNLSDWSHPEKISIENEKIDSHHNNYYNPVVFEYDNNFYMLTPYFKSCGTEKRNCQDGKTIMMMSEDLEKWKIISEFHHHEGKYRDRVNSSLFIDGAMKVFYRENITLNNQSLVCYDLEGYEI
jgi:hypothetical protein